MFDLINQSTNTCVLICETYYESSSLMVTKFAVTGYFSTAEVIATTLLIFVI